MIIFPINKDKHIGISVQRNAIIGSADPDSRHLVQHFQSRCAIPQVGGVRTENGEVNQHLEIRLGASDHHGI